MKAVIAVLVVTYSLFVFIAGDATQKGMLLAVLILLGLILLFYEYAHFARTKISKYEELTRAISVADDLTDLIKQLEDKKALYEGKELLPGLTLGSVIGIIRRSKFKSNIIQSETDTNDRPSQPPQTPLRHRSLILRPRSRPWVRARISSIKPSSLGIQTSPPPRKWSMAKDSAGTTLINPKKTSP